MQRTRQGTKAEADLLGLCMCAAGVHVQDIFNLSLPLTSNLHELLESVKQLGDKVLTAAGGGAEAARKQLLPELAGACRGAAQQRNITGNHKTAHHAHAAHCRSRSCFAGSPTDRPGICSRAGSQSAQQLHNAAKEGP